MLTYVAKAGFTELALGHDLIHWAPEARDLVQVRTYEEFLRPRRTVQTGTWVFADVERLRGPFVDLARSVRDQIVAAGGHALNTPGVTADRRALLRGLHSRGVNDFTFVPLSSWRQVERFPVFLRYASKHTGSIGDLLHDRAQLRRAVRRARMMLRDPRDLILVEFAGVIGSDGYYRKRSVVVIDGVVVPRHLVHGDHWLVKAPLPGPVAPEHLAEEQRYLEENPDAEALSAITADLGIDFARIDYDVADRLRVWEANTNPVLLGRPDEYATARVPAQRRFAAAYVGHIRRLAAHPTHDVVVDVDPAVRRAAAVRSRVEHANEVARTLVRPVKRHLGGGAGAGH